MLFLSTKIIRLFLLHRWYHNWQRRRCTSEAWAMRDDVPPTRTMGVIRWNGHRLKNCLSALSAGGRI
jgi:hypothetical protein